DVAIGGDSDADRRYIAPTVLTGITADDAVMEEEIFGPILPVLAIDEVSDAVRLINDRDKPLALYVFSEEDAEVEGVVEATASGGVCVNGTLFHIANPYLPFGGVGGSGMGAYHGEWGFETFSHRRAIHERSTRFDPPLAYPPYTAGKEKAYRKAAVLPDVRDLTARFRQRLRRSST
ncbi:MAG: aldehyde dehydrogenase family protein, partial [Acidimicrobiia bacterium]